MHAASWVRALDNSRLHELRLCSPQLGHDHEWHAIKMDEQLRLQIAKMKYIRRSI